MVNRVCRRSWHSGRWKVGENGFRSVDHHTARLSGTNQPFGTHPGLSQDGGATTGAVAVRGDDVAPAVPDEAFSVLRGLGAEPPKQRAPSDLEPGATSRERDEVIVVLIHPGQALRVGDDAYVARRSQFEHRLEKARWTDGVGWFDKDVSTPCKREHASGTQPGQDLGDEVDVGAVGQPKRDTRGRERSSEIVHASQNVRAGVLIQAGIDVRRTAGRGDAIRNSHACHGHGHPEVGRAVIDAGQKMAVKIDHGCRSRTTRSVPFNSRRTVANGTNQTGKSEIAFTAYDNSICDGIVVELRVRTVMSFERRDRWHQHRAALGPIALRMSAAESSGEGPSRVLPDADFLRRHGLAMLWTTYLQSLAGWHAQPGQPGVLRSQEVISARLYALAQQRVLDRVASLWTSAGVPWLVLKSVGYREELYGVAELRPTTDIDLLVLPADRSRALALLEASGARRLDTGSAHERTLRLDAMDIDLHWDILAPGRLPSGFAASIIERRVQRGSLWRPDDTDALMIALVHPAFAKHICSEHMGLNRVADLLLMLDRFDVDEPRLVAQLRAAGVASAAWAVLTWVQMVAPAHPPRLERLLSRLAPGGLRRLYIKAWLHNDWPGRLMSCAPWLTAAVLLTALHDRPAHAVRAVRHRFTRRSPA